jgi:hypothetical protein
VQIYLTVGVSMVAGLGVLLMCIPLNFWASRRGEERLDTQLAAKDRRIKLMSEILSGIKVILHQNSWFFSPSGIIVFGLVDKKKYFLVFVLKFPGWFH